MKLQRSIFQDHEYEIRLPFQGIRAFLNAMLIPASVSFACAGNDISICAGDEVALGCANLSASLDVTWSPDNDLSCNTCLNPVATPEVTTTYTMTPTVNSCGVSESTRCYA